MTVDLFRTLLDEELGKLKAQLGADAYSIRHFATARDLFDRITTNDEFMDFLTLAGYGYLA